VTTAIGAQVFLARPLTRLGWLGIAVATAGVVGVTLHDPAGLLDATLGDSLQLLSCITWAIYALAGVRAVEENGALRVAGFSTLVAGALLAPVALGTGWTVAAPDLIGWGTVVYLGLLCNAAAFTLWYRSQRVHGVHRTGATLYFEPFVTLFAATLLLGEEIGARVLVGGLVMLGGVWLVGRGARG